MSATIQPLTFNAAWWAAIDLRLEDRRELSVTRNPDDVESLVKDALNSDYKWAASLDDLPVFAFGATLIDRRRGAHVWAFGSTCAFPVLVPVTKFIKRSMIPLLVGSGVHYAQAISHPENETAHRWLQRLGFSLKATLPGIGGRNEDMLLFVTSADVHRKSAVSFAAA
jgi:hypothetical protein